MAEEIGSVLPSLINCAKCSARFSEAKNSCPGCGEPKSNSSDQNVILTSKEQAKQEASQIRPSLNISNNSVFTVRYMILHQLAERNEPMYVKTIAQNLAPYGVSRDRILIELNKMQNSEQKLVRRLKAGYPFPKKFLYSITENGVNELRKRKNVEANSKSQLIDTPPLDPYLWLLENLIEPKTIEDLTEVRGDSANTLKVYLHHLFKLGVIDKHKDAESKEISQRNRNGDVIKRNTTVMRTYYYLKQGPLREKMVESNIIESRPKTVKMDVPMESLKEPVFTAQLEREYDAWREAIKSKEDFHKMVMRNANRQGVAPKVVYRVVFMQLKKQGKL